MHANATTKSPESPHAVRVRALLACATREWERGVREPPAGNGADVLAYYHRGLGWPWITSYKADGDQEWCGAFAAYCYAAAGLRAEVRYKHLASCSRLVAWARNTERMIEPRLVRAGDIVIVGSAPSLLTKAGRVGSHITLCSQTPLQASAFIETVEGNAIGRGPAGLEYEGVIRRRRSFAAVNKSERRIRYVIRPLPEDFDPLEI